MRLASGIAPITAMLAEGVTVAIGVDGSASNDGGDLLGEARQAMLLQRVAHADGAGPSAMTAREALELATRGGAAVLGRDDVGQIAPGFAADIVAFDLDAIGYAGQHDPVAALVFCAPAKVAWSMINGRIVVAEGRLTTVDTPRLADTHRRLAMALVRDD
jgi:cytosine/adenosine deaminase-related metal-dependent hydrolase